MLNTIEEAVKDLQAGKVIIVEHLGTDLKIISTLKE